MLILASASDKLQIITGSAGTIDVHVSWMDNVAGSVALGRTNTANITTATITDVVASPAAGSQRNIKTMHVHNRGIVNNDITVVHTDGTTPVQLHKVTLVPAGSLEYIDEVGFGVIVGGTSPTPGGGFGGGGGSGGFTTGDAKITFKTSADVGWIMADDGSIGDVTSAATTRANSDTADLFALFYTNITGILPPQTCTITIASPAVITSNNHGLTVGQKVNFTTTGVLPTGITTATSYYVIATGFTINAFQIATTVGGAAVVTTGTQSGTHSFNATSNLTLQDSSGSMVARGTNAAADFALHRRLVIPRMLGRSLAMAGAGAGLALRPLGSFDGNEMHTPTLTELMNHEHLCYPREGGGIHGNLYSDSLTLGSPFAGGLYHDYILAAPVGQSQAYSVLDPRTYLNVMVKL